MIADYGIILEIMGFFLFLASANSPPSNRGSEDYVIGKEKLSRWRFFYLKIPGLYSSQVARVCGVALIIIGLMLQHSWFFNNFPNL